MRALFGSAPPPNKMIPHALMSEVRISVKWTMATRSRYRSFTAKEKLRIIEEAGNIGNHTAGRKYDVSENYIRDWHKKQIANYREEL